MSGSRLPWHATERASPSVDKDNSISACGFSALVRGSKARLAFARCGSRINSSFELVGDTCPWSAKQPVIYSKGSQATSIDRRDDKGFVVSLRPNDVIVFRHQSASPLRKLCA